ncbi:hypothetical protein KKH18_01880 [bacterium]|nr:hypothetical protein [bacterium]
MPTQNENKSSGRKEAGEFQTQELSFIGALLPGILHNLATPLSGVIGATQLMEMRNADQDKLLERLESANSQAAKELITLFEKNKTNLEIIGRNAIQLIDLLQVMVQRFQRCGVQQKVPQSLNELLTNELAFLNANLVFKHKVRREIQLANEPFALPMVYSHVVSVIDEFVTETSGLHDKKQGMAEMSFVTDFGEQSGSLTMKASYIPFETETDSIDTIQVYLVRIRNDGCEYTFSFDAGKVDLALTIPK